MSVVGVFDSGVGGLSVLEQLRVRLPAQQLIYVADQAHVPYGGRPPAQVRAFSEAISRVLLAQGADLIVVACNTASAAALTQLRQTFPAVPFVGMEPAVKPGARRTRQGRIGVLATPGTFGSRRYAGLLARYAQGVEAFEDPCPGLVEAVEAGRLDHPDTEAIVRRALAPMLAAGVDTLVLGCTHYPFVQPLIQRLAGPQVTIIDPAPAVARRVVHLLAERDGQIQPGSGAEATAPTLYTSGDPRDLARAVYKLLNLDAPVHALRWRAQDSPALKLVAGSSEWPLA
ncbi:MAG: glutamate racemase [Candidatus Promineifilaceae bacterium]|nr:glutamate racemase [Candidatus Promineifilaceae bacterium]